MAEVADWSPIDDDNDTAPPVGAPEGMMPSAVNNTMRAMMGSLRRNHDTIVAGTLALPYLPTAGGTVTGNVAINGTGGLTLGATQLRSISNALEVYNASGGAISSRGPTAGLFFGDRNQTSPPWAWLASAGVAYLYDLSGAIVSITGAGRLTTISGGSVNTTSYDIAGILFAQRSGDNAHLIYDADGQIALALYGAAGGNTNYYRADTHNFQNNAGGGIVNFDSGGTISAAAMSLSGLAQVGSLVSVGTITGNGGASIAGTVTGGNFTTGGFVSANQGTFANLDASDIDCPGNIEAVTYTKSGVPVFAATAAEFDALEARIANLESQLAQLKES